MRVFEVWMAEGVLVSMVKMSSADMSGLWSSEQGTIDMEMEGLLVLVGCWRVEGLPELERGLM